MTKSIVLILSASALAATIVLQQAPEVFQPFQPRAYRLVNGPAFDGSEDLMLFALLNREVLAHRGRPDSTAAETGLYISRRSTEGWSEPVLLPFSGSYSDYEPALSADGATLLFNTKRPYADGRTPTRNDLYMVERRDGRWSQPRPVPGINSFELEESYATMDSARRVVFVRGPTREGTDDFTSTSSRSAPMARHRNRSTCRFPARSLARETLNWRAMVRT